MFNAEDLVGKSEAFAKEELQKNGVDVRVQDLDRPGMMTCDWVPTRANLSVRNGVVVSVNWG